MCYLMSLQITILLRTIQNDVISHAETFPHSKMVEKGRLAKGVAHFHHCNICEGGL